MDRVVSDDVKCGGGDNGGKGMVFDTVNKQCEYD